LSYDPKWSEIYHVERFLQIDINDSTHPSDTDVLDWIEEAETSILKKGMGTQTTGSGTVMTVLPTEAISKGSVSWFMAGLPETEYGRLATPPFKPIVSVTSGAFYRNKASLSDTPNWEILICKDNLPTIADTDFLIVKKYNHKTGNNDGVAFYFFHDIPEAGRRRVSGGWVYGYNLDSHILREYVTLQVSKKVLRARLMSAEPIGLAEYRGPDLQTYVNTNIEAQLLYINERLEEIEKNHFPEEVPVAVLQGI